MTGICGWIGSGDNYNNAEQKTIIKNMVFALDGGNEIQNNHLHHHSDIIASTHHSGTGASHLHEELLISYSGDLIWRDKQLKEIAARHGHTAAIAQAYRDRAERMLELTHGPFSLAVLDCHSKQALIAIDRMGIQPLCFWHRNGTLVYGSNTNAIIAHSAVSPCLDSQAIFDYLYFHMVPSPRTIYQNIGKLLPGQYLKLQNGRLTTDFYWHLEYQDRASTPQPQLKKELNRLLRDAVRRNAGAGITGAFLSGGTDSSTMAGILTEVLGKPAHTYSIGFDAEGYDETEFARLTAAHFGTVHKEYYVTPENVVDVIPTIAASYDEPFGNASAIPTYFCAKMARDDGIDVLLAGDGGDEIFAGNARYAKQQVFDYYQRIPAILRSAVIEPVLLNFPGMETIAPLRKLKSYIEQARVPLPDRLECYNFLHRTPLAGIFTESFLSSIDDDEPLTICRNAYQSAHSGAVLNKMLHLDLKNTLADNDLRKVNRMCQLAGVEVRYPLLDEEIVEFSAQVPANLKLKGETLRYFFKQALRDFLPPSTLSKSKHGFGLPFGLWMREYAPLRELAYDSLLKFRHRGFLHQTYIDDLQKKHNTEHASYYGVMIWVIMMLEQWLEHHTEAE